MRFRLLISFVRIFIQMRKKNGSRITLYRLQKFPYINFGYRLPFIDQMIFDSFAVGKGKSIWFAYDQNSVVHVYKSGYFELLLPKISFMKDLQKNRNLSRFTPRILDVSHEYCYRMDSLIRKDRHINSSDDGLFDSVIDVWYGFISDNLDLAHSCECTSYVKPLISSISQICQSINERHKTYLSVSELGLNSFINKIDKGQKALIFDFCHGDLNIEKNVIFDGGNPYIIDWDDAFQGSLFYDLFTSFLYRKKLELVNNIKAQEKSILFGYDRLFNEFSNNFEIYISIFAIEFNFLKLQKLALSNFNSKKLRKTLLFLKDSNYQLSKTLTL